MELQIGNARIKFLTTFCSAENQDEKEQESLKRMSRIASLALAAVHIKAS